MGDLRKAQNDYISAVNDIIHYQTELMDKTGKDAAENAAQSRIIVISILVIALVLGVLLGIMITRSIVRPINACVDAANRIAAGDMDVKLDTISNDETGVLQKAMQKMVEAVKALVTDAHALSEAAVAGRLATRADAGKHQGDFQKVIAGVNNTLDAVIGPLNVAARYVDGISKGDMPKIITDNYNGDFNDIKIT